MQATEEFPFPFLPYPIQNEFMKKLYECLENANLGIFESPTGTGKSMSIICSALKWLIDHEELQKQQLNTAISQLDERIEKCNNSSDNWFSVQTEQIELNRERQTLQAKLNSILRHERKKNALKKAVEDVDNKKRSYNRINVDRAKHKTEKGTDNVDELNTKEDNVEEELLLEEITERSDNSEDEDNEEEVYENRKIFFCSRTHSQLSQFIGEVRKSPYSKNVSVVTLASR